MCVLCMFVEASTRWQAHSYTSLPFSVPHFPPRSLPNSFSHLMLFHSAQGGECTCLCRITRINIVSVLQPCHIQSNVGTPGGMYSSLAYTSRYALFRPHLSSPSSNSHCSRPRSFSCCEKNHDFGDVRGTLIDCIRGYQCITCVVEHTLEVLGLI